MEPRHDLRFHGRSSSASISSVTVGALLDGGGGNLAGRRLERGLRIGKERRSWLLDGGGMGAGGGEAVAVSVEVTIAGFWSLQVQEPTR
jgi:hypothetical protein